LNQKVDGANPSGAAIFTTNQTTHLMLNSHDRMDRQVLAIARELKHFRYMPYPTKPLDPPVQRGWRRSYVLSDRAMNRPDQSVLEAILKVIGSSVVHHNRNFHRRRGKSKKLFEIEQPLRPIPIHEWKRENYPTAWQRYFQYRILLTTHQRWQPYWVFMHPLLYRLKIERNWITEVRVIDPDTESRIQELEEWMEFHHGWHRYGRLKGRRQGYRWYNIREKRRLLDNEHHREIANAYKTFPEVDPAASAWRIPTSLRPIFPIFPGVAQCRGSELRTRPVQVRVLPPGPWNVNRTSVPGFFAKEIVPRSAGWGACPPYSAIFPTGRVAQLAEARRRERRECWFKSSRDHHFSGPEA
jgi:hypothetical protein